jgi:hypothetical protein
MRGEAMKRDMDLVRKILIFMSENDEGAHVLWANAVPGYTPEQIFHHAALMQQGGLIISVDTTCLEDKLPMALPLSITWDGHEFLDSSRDPTLWEKAKKHVIAPSGGVAMSVLTEWLKSQATAALALA